jgi:hypothetical protein
MLEVFGGMMLLTERATVILVVLAVELKTSPLSLARKLVFTQSVQKPQIHFSF